MQPPIVVSHKNSGTKANENVLFGARTWWNNSVFLLIPAPQVHFHRKNLLERFSLHFTGIFMGRKANITPWNSFFLWFVTNVRFLRSCISRAYTHLDTFSKIADFFIFTFPSLTHFLLEKFYSEMWGKKHWLQREIYPSVYGLRLFYSRLRQ